MGTMQALIGRADPLQVSAPSIAAFAMNNPPGNQPATVSGASTATASGGSPPYTFSWAQQSSTGLAITYGGTATATLAASRSGPPGSSTAVVRVTVSDAGGQSATADITVSLELDSGL